MPTCHHRAIQAILAIQQSRQSNPNPGNHHQIIGVLDSAVSSCDFTTHNSQTAPNNNQLIFPYNSKYGKQNKMQNAHRQLFFFANINNSAKQPSDFFFSFFFLVCCCGTYYYYHSFN